jgi:hypothetical protein
MRQGRLEQLRHRIINTLMGTRGADAAKRLEVRLMDGTHQEIVDITYPDNRDAIVLIARPLNYEEYMLGETRKIQEVRKTAADAT